MSDMYCEVLFTIRALLHCDSSHRNNRARIMSKNIEMVHLKSACDTLFLCCNLWKRKKRRFTLLKSMLAKRENDMGNVGQGRCSALRSSMYDEYLSYTKGFFRLNVTASN